MTDKKFYKNPYFIISGVYLLTHVFSLILSGCWWDDWTFMTHNLSYVNAVATQSGRPEWNLLIPFCWSLTNNGRILIFFLYYLDSVLLFNGLKLSGLFDEKESLLITLLFILIPVNEARILISNFAYTVGLFFFFLAFNFFIRFNKNRKWIYRIVVLFLFFISFILNSLLAYYYVLFIYLFVLDFKDKKLTIKNIYESVKNVIIRNIDFFVLPFLYLLINKTFFPTNGDSFGDYNSFGIKSIIKACIYIPLSIVTALFNILMNWLSSINVLSGIVLLVCLYLLYRKRKYEDEKIDYRKSLTGIFYSLCILVLALIAYVLIREEIISINGVQGRDAILIPFGMALLIHSLLDMLKAKLRDILYVLIIVLGISCFNLLYIEWQKDYYYQLSMENLFYDEIIKNNDTFFLVDLNESDVKGQRFYSLNTNAYHVFKDQTRLFIPKVSNLYLLENENTLKHTIEALDYANMMKDYKPEDYNFDAIIVYENKLSDFETVKLKYYEMFDYERFVEMIKSKGSLKVYEVDDDFTRLLIKEYKDRKVLDDEGVLKLLEEYRNK